MAKNDDLALEEILATCRRLDGQGGGGGAPQASSAAEASETSASPAAPATSDDLPAASKPAPASAGDARKMSVEEMLAAARGQKAASKAAATTAPPKAATTKPAAKAAPAAKSKPKAAAGPTDTSSILAAARTSAKAGPVSKSQAAARQKSAAPEKSAAKAKPVIVVPPMPEKPDYAKPKPVRSGDEDRRGFMSVLLGSFLAVGFTSVGLVSGLWGLLLARFMFPNIRTEPPNRFKVGFPSDFADGTVATKFKAQFGVWIVNTDFEGEQQITALQSICTHLGCTPNWLEGEQKFKCPCHGSGFYKDGINFEGPAPRPLERYAIRIADDGQIEVDKSRTFQEEMGQWTDSNSFIPV